MRKSGEVSTTSVVSRSGPSPDLRTRREQRERWFLGFVGSQAPQSPSARGTPPDDRIIVETDCPYLAPVPYRGRRNEPAYLPHVLAKLAEIRGWSAGEAEARTEAAFIDLFDRIPRPAGGAT